MSVRVSVRGRSLGPEHAAQHGQSLHVADMAVVVQPGHKDSQWWSLLLPQRGRSQSLLHLQRGRSQTHSVSRRWRPNGCLAQGVSVSGSESGLRSWLVAAEARAQTLATSRRPTASAAAEFF